MATEEPSSGGLVVFACPHGVGKSRMAAAIFQATARERGLAGWSAATAAGEEPGRAVSPHAVRLLAGTPAEPFLQPGQGHRLPAVLAAISGTLPAGTVAGRVLVVAIDCDPPDIRADRYWRLAGQDPGESMREEISTLVTGLVDDLVASGRSIGGSG